MMAWLTMALALALVAGGLLVLSRVVTLTLVFGETRQPAATPNPGRLATR